MILNMKSISDRKELFTLIGSVSESNRKYFSRYGNWKSPQIKVFWIEVNKQYINNLIQQSGSEKIDRDLFEINYNEDRFWLDTSDERLWQIFTFAESGKTNQMINNKITKYRGADRAWFTEIFLKKIQKHFGYDNRGFGIKFKDSLSFEEPTSDFSAKLWLGKSCTSRQKKFLKAAQDTFSVSTIRFGHKEHIDNTNISGKLYELYYNGHLTVNTCDDLEDFFSLINYIKHFYRDEIEFLEKEFNKKPTFVEVIFTDKIDPDGFTLISYAGKGKLKLWLEPFEKEKDIIRYAGVDLHTGDFVNIDLADRYSYLTASKGSCMNFAPRFGTLASRYLSTGTQIKYDGVDIFA